MAKRYKMTSLAAFVGLTLLGVTVAPGNAAVPSRVNALTCAQSGGTATIAGGTEVEIGLGNILKNRGLTTDFLRMERTSISVDGGAPADVSGFWSAPIPAPFPAFTGDWFTRFVYDTGVVLGAGESMTFEFVLAEPHLYLDDLTFENGTSGQPVLFPPNVYTYDCTVTAT